MPQPDEAMHVLEEKASQLDVGTFFMSLSFIKSTFKVMQEELIVMHVLDCKHAY